MLLPNRHGSSTAYRYGFQGQEKDDELKGEGNSLNYTFRMHDPRVGRFFAVDPLESKFPFYSPYQFSSNTPISAVELEGLETSDNKNINENGSELNRSEYNEAYATVLLDELELNATLIVNKINSETGINQDNAVFRPEVRNQYYPSFSKNEYIEKYGAHKYYQYTRKDAVAFHNWTLDRIKESNDAELLYKLTYGLSFFKAIEDLKDFVPVGAGVGAITKSLGGLGNKTYAFKGILSERQILLSKLNFNNNRGLNYFTQDEVHQIFSYSAYRETILYGKMTKLSNGTFGFERSGLLRRYELGIKPDGSVIHNNSFRLESWKGGYSFWWR